MRRVLWIRNISSFTALYMPIILSDGKLNISTLAKNASTSVDQMERFYVRNMPLSMER